MREIFPMLKKYACQNVFCNGFQSIFAREVLWPVAEVGSNLARMTDFRCPINDIQTASIKLEELQKKKMQREMEAVQRKNVFPLLARLFESPGRPNNVA